MTAAVGVGGWVGGVGMGRVCLLHLLCRVGIPVLEPVQQEVAVPKTFALLLQLLDGSYGLRILHHLDEATLLPCRKAAVREHSAGVRK